QRVGPLLPVFLVAPASLVSLDVGLSALPEGHRPGRLDLLSRPARLAGLNGVDARLELLPTRAGRATSLREGHICQRAQPHGASPAIEHEPEEPGLHSGLRDLEVQAAAIRIEAGLVGPRHRKRIQPADCSHYVRYPGRSEIHDSQNDPQTTRGLWR